MNFHFHIQFAEYLFIVALLAALAAVAIMAYGGYQDRKYKKKSSSHK